MLCDCEREQVVSGGCALDKMVVGCLLLLLVSVP